MKRHRYRQEALPLLGSQPRDYSPQPQQLAGPVQGWLALDSGALGPLFDDHTNTNTAARSDRRGQPSS
jgi:hypothetical protein